MKLVLKDALCEAAMAENEDAWGMNGGEAAWVIDGATGLGEQLLRGALSDAAAYAQQANIQFKSTLKEKNTDLRTDLRRTVKALGEWVQSNLIREPESLFELPSAATGLIKINSDKLNMAFLGDIKCILGRGQNCITYGSSPLEALERNMLEELAGLQRRFPDATAEEIRNALNPILRQNRSLMNTENGYWVMSDDTRAAEHAYCATDSIEPGDQILLMSDGFYRLIDTFNLYSPHNLMARATAPNGLSFLYNELRIVENSDPDGRRYPRVKKSDDATAIFLTIK